MMTSRGVAESFYLEDKRLLLYCFLNHLKSSGELKQILHCNFVTMLLYWEQLRLKGVMPPEMFCPPPYQPKLYNFILDINENAL